MKILFIAFITRNTPTEELGIAYISSYLESKGFPNDIYYITDFTDRDLKTIVSYSPDIIAVNVYSSLSDKVFKMIDKIKQELKNVLVVAGGYHTLIGPERILNNTCIDVVIKGEGEETFYEMIKSIREGKSLAGIKGLSFRDGDKITENPDRDQAVDLSALPFPRRDFLNKVDFRYLTISTSRGCYHNCSFCVSRAYWGKCVRTRNADNVIEEIVYLTQRYGRNRFMFLDASFENTGINKERILDLAERIIDRNIKISYLANMRCDFHKNLSIDELRLLKRSGLDCVLLGVESGNEADLKLFNKALKLEDNIKAIQILDEEDIAPTYGFINYTPFSTIEGLAQNNEFISKYLYKNVFLQVHRLVLYPKLPLLKLVERENLLAGWSDTEGEYSYRFRDERVAKLYILHRALRSKVLLKNYPFMRLYVDEANILDKRIKRFIPNLNEEALSRIDEFKRSNMAALMEYNTRYKLLYDKLIQLSLAGADEAGADMVGDYRDMMSNLYKALIANRYSLLRYLSKASIDEKLLSQAV